MLVILAPTTIAGRRYIADQGLPAETIVVTPGTRHRLRGLRRPTALDLSTRADHGRDRAGWQALYAEINRRGGTYPVPKQEKTR